VKTGYVAASLPLIIILLFLNGNPVWSQNRESSTLIIHKPGDFSFSINAGTMVPFFNIDMNMDIQKSGINLGPMASLTLEVYFNKNLAIGFDIGGFTGNSVNGNPLMMVPLSVHLGWERQWGSFSGGINVGLGSTLVSYLEFFNMDFMAKFGLELVWHRDSRWAFGLRPTYLVDLQEADPREQSRIGNFGEFLFCTRYFF